MAMKKVAILLLLLMSKDSFSQETGAVIVPSLSYPQVIFDSDTCCWRKLTASGKYHEAAELMVLYLHSRNASNKHALYWHTGQMYAMAHEYELATKYFKKTYAKVYLWFGDSDAKTWYYYARGTVAFIKEDRKVLDKVIQTWSHKFPPDKNYNALLKLNAHWGDGYEIILEN